MIAVAPENIICKNNFFYFLNVAFLFLIGKTNANYLKYYYNSSDFLLLLA